MAQGHAPIPAWGCDAKYLGEPTIAGRWSGDTRTSNQVLRDELAELNACVETGTHEVDGLFSGDLRVRRTRGEYVTQAGENFGCGDA